MQCPNCGHQAADNDPICPACGLGLQPHAQPGQPPPPGQAYYPPTGPAPQYPPYYPPQPPKSETDVSLIMGIISMVMVLLSAGILAIPCGIAGIIIWNQQQSKGRVQNKVGLGLSIAGLCLGVVTIVLLILMYVLIFAAFIPMFSYY